MPFLALFTLKNQKDSAILALKELPITSTYKQSILFFKPDRVGNQVLPTVPCEAVVAAALIFYVTPT